MRGKVTKRTVDGLVVPGGADEATLWDTEIKGFGIRARASGTKTYILHYRAGCGRAAPLRKVTIGKHGSPWTPETARGEAKQLLGQVANGSDPAKLERATRQHSPLPSFANSISRRVSLTRRKRRSVAIKAKSSITLFRCLDASEWTR